MRNETKGQKKYKHRYNENPKQKIKERKLFRRDRKRKPKKENKTIKMKV